MTRDTTPDELRAAPARKWETIPDQVKRLGRVGSWAPGSYLSKCVLCECQFEGDKRAMHCLPCAVSALLEAQAEAERLRGENETLRLTMLGGEDVPGLAASLSLESVISTFTDYQQGLRALYEASIDAVRDAAQARADRLEGALREAPVMSKYHGMRGFEADRFIDDYEAWRVTARSALSPTQREGKEE